MLMKLTDMSARNEREGSVKAGGIGFGSFCRCQKTVECVTCLLGRWNRSRRTGSILDHLFVGLTKGAEKTSGRKSKQWALSSVRVAGIRRRCGCQDKKRMEKQHGVNIMAVEVQIGWLWMWLGRRSDDFECDRGGGRCPRKVENRDGSKVIKAAVTQGRE
ncbi:hypothetical protein Tco_1380641 [Tanacetum coccineum]